MVKNFTKKINFTPTGEAGMDGCDMNLTADIYKCDETLCTMNKDCDKPHLQPSFSFRRYETARRRPCCYLVVSTLLFATTVTVVICLIIGFPLRQATSNKCSSFLQDSNLLCTSCSAVKQDESHVLSQNSVPSVGMAWRRIEPGCDVCCTEYNENTERLLGLISIQSQMNTTQPNTVHKRPAAHVNLNVTALKYSENKEALTWVTRDYMTSFLQGDARYVNDSIQIPESGEYFVYSFITFSFNKADDFKKNPMVYHHVSLTRPTSDGRLHSRMLMLNKQTRNQGVYQTSFLTAVLKLQANDRVATFVSDPDSIYLSASSNYMGLFKL